MPTNCGIEDTTYKINADFQVERLSLGPSIDGNLDSADLSGKGDDYKLLIDLRRIRLAEALNSKDQTLMARARLRIERFWKQLGFSSRRARAANVDSPTRVWGNDDWIHASLEKTFLEKIYDKQRGQTGM